MTIISATNLSKTVKSGTETIHILKNISLSVNKGETISVIGASGSGKSSLLGILASLDIPTEGEVNLLGQRLSNLDEEARARIRMGKVGFVFQAFHLLSNLTALENVMLPLEILGEKTNSARKRATHLLEQVGLKERVTHKPLQLSGGEQQRVAIARAFVTQPTILFADEPTGNLDATTGDKIIDLLFSLNDECQTTLILVTHDEKIAARSQRLLKLDRGQLI